jgi:RNA polymerase sigma factor (sigma-70 family)
MEAKGREWTGPSSLLLIRRAKAGDRPARDEIVRRYYPLWLRKFHGRLGRRLKRIADTQAMINLGIMDALRKLPELEHDAAFFSFVSVFIARRISQERRREARRQALPLDEVPPPARADPRWEDLEREEEHARLLKAVYDLFPLYPDPMTAVHLRYYEGLEVDRIVAALKCSKRKVEALLKAGRELVASRLGSA